MPEPFAHNRYAATSTLRLTPAYTVVATQIRGGPWHWRLDETDALRFQAMHEDGEAFIAHVRVGEVVEMRARAVTFRVVRRAVNAEWRGRRGMGFS